MLENILCSKKTYSFLDAKNPLDFLAFLHSKNLKDFLEYRR